MEKSKFREMFVVDPEVANFKKGDRLGCESIMPKLHPYNINNMQRDENGVIYDMEDSYYISEVEIQIFEKLKPSEISAFLSYHFKYSKKKDRLISFIKYDIWERFNEYIPIPAHRESAIKDWLEKIIDKRKSDTQSFYKTIKNMFPTILEADIITLLENLDGSSKYLSLIYVGTRESFYKDIGKLRSVGYKRQILAHVFTSFCEIENINGSKSERMDENALYKKIIIK